MQVENNYPERRRSSEVLTHVGRALLHMVYFLLNMGKIWSAAELCYCSPPQQSETRRASPPSASPQPAAQLGFVTLSNETQPHAFQTHSTGTSGSRWHSHSHAGWLAGGIAGRLCPGHAAEDATLLQASLVQHASTGLLWICLFCLLLQQPRDRDQSNTDNTEREDLGGLDGQKGVWVQHGESQTFSSASESLVHYNQCCKSCAHEEFSTCISVHRTQLFFSQNMFKIAVTVASTTGKRLIIMLLGKISSIKQGKINTNNQTFSPIIYKQHSCDLYSVEKAKGKLTCW